MMRSTVIIGHKTTIATAAARLIWGDIEIARTDDARLDADCYLICSGFLAGKTIGKQDACDTAAAFEVNFCEIARFCDVLIAANDRARICVIGSESGIAGSFDMAYAGAKAALHLYIERKALRTPHQLLVAVAPHIIVDSGMTDRRDDTVALLDRGARTRLGRWLNAGEVAETVAWLLNDASPSLSNQIIRMRAQ